MANQSFILMTEAECLSGRALDIDGSGVAFGGRQIDNVLANGLGNGTIYGGATTYYVVNARILDDADYGNYHNKCTGFTKKNMDSDKLFLPAPSVD